MSGNAGALVLFEARAHRVLVRADGIRTTEGTPPDVSKVSGARVVAWLDFRNDTSHTLAGCVVAPSTRFASGIEDVLFERATSLALSSLGATPRELSVTAHRTNERSFEQIRSGKSDRGSLVVHHLITFDGEESELVLCSLACEGQSCSTAMLSVEGEPPLAPPPNTFVKAITWAAERPQLAVAGLGFVVLLVSAIILWRRPRPRPV